MSSIKFERETTTENGIITSVSSTIFYETVKDQYHNEIATIINHEKRREVSSICKQLEGSKYSVFVDKSTGVPCGMEHDVSGEIGGLWFKNKRLEDYDGCGCLPSPIIKLVRKLGFTVPRDFEN